MSLPPLDPELGAVLDLVSDVYPSSVTPEMIPLMRQTPDESALADLVTSVGAVHEERTIKGYDGGEIVISIYRNPDSTTKGPGIFHIHGGGMIIGNRFIGVGQFIP